jgi:hypothetical protein
MRRVGGEGAEASTTCSTRAASVLK